MKTTLILAALPAVLMLASCTKRGEDTSTAAASDNALAEKVFDDLFAVSDYVAKNYNGLGKTTQAGDFLPGCATVTVDTVKREAVVDFGATNCLSPDGNYRRGKLTASFTGKYSEPGTVITITTDNYYINDNSVSGVKTVTNNGRNNAGLIGYTIQAHNARIETPRGSITWESNRTREWIAGEATPEDVMDDVYLVRGSASGKTIQDNGFTVTITDPLRAETACPYLTAGVIELQPEGLSKRTVNYGSGACDSEATVTIRGKHYKIVLR